MSQTITLTVSEDAVRRIKDIADLTHRQLEDVMVDLIDYMAAQPPVEMLPDEQVLALCDLQMNPEDDAELSRLLADQSESRLDEVGRIRLNELMTLFRRSLVRKTEALKVAIQRGLRPPPDVD